MSYPVAIGPYAVQTDYVYVDGHFYAELSVIWKDKTFTLSPTQLRDVQDGLRQRVMEQLLRAGCCPGKARDLVMAYAALFKGKAT